MRRTAAGATWARARRLARTRVWAAAAGIVFAAALLAACGGDDSAQQQSTATGDRQDRQQQQAPSDDGRQRQERQDGGQSAEQDARQEQATPRSAEPQRAVRDDATLRIARSSPLNLDPAQVTDVDSAIYVVEIFGGLLTLDQDLRIAPDLAESVPGPTVNSDGTVTYRFTLRSDASFHDGKRISAEDVKWSLERHAAPETLSPTAPDFLGDIVGAREYTRGRAEEIVGIQVIDELTVDITIDAAKPYFLFLLTFPTAFVVDRTQVEADPERWALQPNGSGPFKLAEWTLGESIVLERFDDYHLGPAGVETVNIRFGGGVEQFENDEIDISGVGINDIERVRDPASDLNQLYVTRNELSIFYIAFNTSSPPFDDPLVRRALAHAIDKATIVETVLQELVREARGIIPPGLAAHDPDYLGLPFDPELAQELLAQSSYADSPILETIRLTVPGQGATSGPSIEAIQAMWLEHLGLEIEIQQIEFATFISELDRGLYPMFSLGWSLDFPDPQNVLDYKFYSRSLGNDVALDDREIDGLLEDARLEFDSARRIELYREVESRLVDDAVWIPLYHSQAHEVVKPYVEGYAPTRMIVPQLRYVRLTQ